MLIYVAVMRWTRKFRRRCAACFQLMRLLSAYFGGKVTTQVVKSVGW